ncbi:MAG: flavodoxin family protein [Candidatus Atribacteria bacterium]|nr:flavodoxin family protein [Candidatus Atribacteria bacterium]
MNMLLLNGVSEKEDDAYQIYQVIDRCLKESDHQVHSYNLYQMNIAPCMGCFACWIDTPGECIINDDGRLIAKELMQHDAVIFLSPVTFGGYSFELKKAVDRFIPNVMPFFRINQNEIHHIPRYQKYPNLIFIGTLPDKNPGMENTFFHLNQRNVINMYPNLYSQAIFYYHQSEEEIRIKFHQLMKDVEQI